MARPARFERATLCLEGRCSIQLSYGRVSYLDIRLFVAKASTISWGICLSRMVTVQMGNSVFLNKTSTFSILGFTRVPSCYQLATQGGGIDTYFGFCDEL